jgi:hypothetical protein
MTIPAYRPPMSGSVKVMRSADTWIERLKNIALTGGIKEPIHLVVPLDKHLERSG